MLMMTATLRRECQPVRGIVHPAAVEVSLYIIYVSTISTISTISTLSTVCIYIILYRLSRYDPLLDSSNMTMDDWIQIAKDIRESYANFDGCVSIL